MFLLPPHTTHITQPLDNGCFGALKTYWKEECHSYMLKNPGRVVTQFQFSELFSHAWSRGMTMSNIISGFKCTGVYPVNRNAIIIERQCSTVFDPSSLSRETGLNFIPLYSPARPRKTASCSAYDFSREELDHFQSCYEEEYDITTNLRYNIWLQMYVPSKLYFS